MQQVLPDPRGQVKCVSFRKNKMMLTEAEQKLESHLGGAAILLFSSRFTSDELRSEHLHLVNGKKELNYKEANRQHDL